MRARSARDVPRVITEAVLLGDPTVGPLDHQLCPFAAGDLPSGFVCLRLRVMSRDQIPFDSPADTPTAFVVNDPDSLALSQGPTGTREMGLRSRLWQPRITADSCATA